MLASYSLLFVLFGCRFRCSAEDCALYCSHRQAWLSVLLRTCSHWGIPLLNYYSFSPDALKKVAIDFFLPPILCMSVCPDQHGTAISTCCCMSSSCCMVLHFSHNCFLAATLNTSESTLLWQPECVWVEWIELLAEFFRKVVNRALLWESGLGPTRLLIKIFGLIYLNKN